MAQKHRIWNDEADSIVIEKPDGSRTGIKKGGTSTKLPAKPKRKPSKRKQRKTK